MTVYVVVGYNGLLKAYGIVGVSKSIEGAERIRKEHEYMLDDSDIQKAELED
jgi:hypothetical protein